MNIEEKFKQLMEDIEKAKELVEKNPTLPNVEKFHVLIGKTIGYAQVCQQLNNKFMKLTHGQISDAELDGEASNCLAVVVLARKKGAIKK